MKCSDIPVWNAYRRLHIFGKMLILEEQFSRLRGAGFAKLQKPLSKIAALEGARFTKLHLNSFPEARILRTAPSWRRAFRKTALSRERFSKIAAFEGARFPISKLHLNFS